MELIHKELAFKIIGCAIEFHKTLGVGFLDSVYENALKIELGLQNIIIESQKKYPVIYKGKIVKDFLCDLIVKDKVVLELKAIK